MSYNPAYVYLHLEAAMKSLILLSLFVTVNVLYAEGSEPYNCVRPMKPLKFTSNQEVDAFNRDVQNYKQCIDTFISRHKDNIEKSTEAINAAVADWNRFVSMNNSQQEVRPSPTKNQNGFREDTSRNGPNGVSTGFSF